MPLGRQPTGVVAFLFSDVEGSTSLLQRVGQDAFISIIEQHHVLLRQEIARFNGWEFATAGDSFCVAFASATDAVACAVALQVRIERSSWLEPVRVRVGLHVGEVAKAGDNYVGLAVHVAARVQSAAWGGQILLSEAVAREATLGEGLELVELGQFTLKDVGTHRLFELRRDEGPSGFPPPRAPARDHLHLPSVMTNLVGREDNIADLANSLRTHRLVTLLGPGGIGKTRLALAAAAAVADQFSGVWWVDLTKADADTEVSVAAALGRAMLAEGDVSATLEREERPLLVFDNCEHVATSVARVASVLLTSHSRQTIATTSRRTLGLAGEVVFRVPGLPTPPEDVHVRAEDIQRYPSLDLFCQRAAAMTGTEVPEAALGDIAALVRRVGGLPLAIELAAARSASFTAADIGAQLSTSLLLLRNPDPTVDERQATLDGALAWSWNLLDTCEQTVLRRLAAVHGGITIDLAAAVCGDAVAGRTELWDCVHSLCRHSLLAPETGLPKSVFRFHPLVREYAMARLDAAEAANAVARIDRWLVEYSEQKEDATMGWDHDLALRELDVHEPDLLAALDRLAAAEPDSAVDMVTSLGFWLTSRGHARKGFAILDACRPRLTTARSVAAIEGQTIFAGLQTLPAMTASEFARVVPDLEATAARHDAVGAEFFGHYLRGMAALCDPAPDLEVFERALIGLGETQLWLELAFRAVRTLSVPKAVRARLRDRMLELGEKYRRPTHCRYPDIAASYLEEGRTDDAVALLRHGLAIGAPPPSQDHWVMNQGAAAVLLVADRPGEAIPHLEELALVRDGDGRTFEPPPGTSGRARALLAALAGNPMAPPADCWMYLFGWALDLALIDTFLTAGDVSGAARIASTCGLRGFPFLEAWARIAAAAGDEEVCARACHSQGLLADRRAQLRHDRPALERRWWEAIDRVASRVPEPEDVDSIRLDYDAVWKVGTEYLRQAGDA